MLSGRSTISPFPFSGTGAGVSGVSRTRTQDMLTRSGGLLNLEGREHAISAISYVKGLAHREHHGATMTMTGPALPAFCSEVVVKIRTRDGFNGVSERHAVKRKASRPKALSPLTALAVATGALERSFAFRPNQSTGPPHSLQGSVNKAGIGPTLVTWTTRQLDPCLWALGAGSRIRERERAHLSNGDNLSTVSVKI